MEHREDNICILIIVENACLSFASILLEAAADAGICFR